MERKIREFIRLFSGFQSRKGVDLQPEGNHYLLQIRDFDESRTFVNPGGLGRINAPAVDAEACLREGDVLFLAKGVRNFAYAIPDSLPTPLLAGSYFFILRPTENVFAPYLAWFLNQEPVRRYFFRYATTGAHIPVVRREELENLVVPLPRLDTQQKIVELAGLANRQASLLAELAEKKNTLATSICLRAARESFSISK